MGLIMKKQNTILVVEDERIIRDALVDVLTLKKFIALQAADGQEGVKVALSQHPDLILLDLLMPVMDGMTALKKIREDSWGANVPVIILTNMNATSEETVNDVVTNKPLHYFIKADWKIYDIVKEINKVLQD